MIKPHRVLGATAVTLVALSVSACGGGDANQPAKPPAPAATVTVTPDWLTGLPAPSRSCTTGC